MDCGSGGGGSGGMADDEGSAVGGGGGRKNNDLDIESASLLEKFGCMQTLDHDDLVSQMLRLIGDDSALNTSTAKFYLEMNMWNVQAAVCSYFDLESGNVKLPSMTFIKDITIGEGESIPPSAVFIKTWKVHNTGADRWPEGSVLKFASGTLLASKDSVRVNPLLPWQMADVSVEMQAPSAPGIYQSIWRMMTPNGCYFGDPIFVITSVEPGGTLALTQQMSNFHQLGGESSSNFSNPFAASPPVQQQPSNPSTVHHDDIEMD